MPTNITYNLTMLVSDGPKIVLSDTKHVEAYGVLKVEIEKSKSANVELQPTADPKRVKYLFITSDIYDEKIKYTIDEAAKEIVLDGPHTFFGKGAISTLGETPPKVLKFKNDLAKNVLITIFVGRDAVSGGGT